MAAPPSSTGSTVSSRRSKQPSLASTSLGRLTTPIDSDWAPLSKKTSMLWSAAFDGSGVRELTSASPVEGSVENPIQGNSPSSSFSMWVEVDR